MQPLLQIDDLSLEFATDAGIVHALDGIAFSIERGECVALVGESGSGKSITGLAIMRLLGDNAVLTSGAISLDGVSLLTRTESELRAVRGKHIAMIFQNAKASLNPIRRVGDVLIDILRAHAPRRMPRSTARTRAINLLGTIGIVDPEKRMAAYPSELSGGMCQRIMIAAAFACEPELVIADEPTSALDVTTQRLVMDLLMTSCRQRKVAAIFITHDLALASEYADRVMVMHAGQILEQGSAEAVFRHPAQPYTRMLLESLPYGKENVSQLQAMGGALPDLKRTDLPRCRFFERCPRAEPVCRDAALPSRMLASGSLVRCHFPYEA